MMTVPIRVNAGFREASVEFVTRPDFSFLRQWKACVAQDSHPVRRDSVDFATLACKRFTAHSAIENYAQDVGDIVAHITDNPHSEVASLILVRCDWFPESDIIGVAHFRRSWCNNIILDYLAAHPLSAARPAVFSTDISGIGIALLCFISRVAGKLGSGAIWGEATQNSCNHYKNFFKLESVDDLLYIEREKSTAFADAIEQKWLQRELKWKFEI